MPASARSPVPADPPPRAARRIECVRVTTTIGPARAAWDALLAVAPASAYQTPGWVEAWLATRAVPADPLFVIGLDRLGPVALLALGRTRRAGVRVARFLGGRDANFGAGLFHPDLDSDARGLTGLLAEAARLGGIDLFWLGNQPEALGGRTNPMTALPGRPSPSLQHEAVLDAPADTILTRLLSARARKHLRQKEGKLGALGPVRHEAARNRATAEAIASDLLAQRGARFGPSHDDAELNRFLLAGWETGAIELHALRCGDATVATFAGAGHAGRYSGMVLSFASAETWARYSPGELLVARILAAKALEGNDRFDLGIGEARYKASFCPVAVPLFDTMLGVTGRGRAAARGLGGLLAAKRWIKQSPRAWAAAGHIAAPWRRLRARGRPSGGGAA